MKEKKDKSLLVYRFSSFGDISMIVPVLRSFYQIYPDQKIIFVSRHFVKPLFLEFANLTFKGVDFKLKYKGLKGIFMLYKELKQERIIGIADLHFVIRTFILNFFFRLSFYKVASINKGRRERKKLIRKRNKVFQPLTPMHFRYCEVFRKLGFPVDLNNHEYPNKPLLKDSYLEERINLGNKIIGIAPFASNEGKTYPLDHMQKVIAYLQKHYFVFLFGGGEDNLEYGGMLEKPVINHAEDVCLRSDGVMNEGKMSTKLGLPGNPVEAEGIMVHRDLELAKLTGAKIHVPHMSTKQSVDHVAEMKKHYDNVSAEVAPHHLFFTDKDLYTFDTQLKVAPPIRSKTDKKALIEGLKNGTIDCIATDHAPHTIEEKETTFDLAAFGMIGLESCLGAVMKVLVQEKGIDLMTVIKALTVNPREVMGFNTSLCADKTPAEITVFDAGETWEFTKNNIYSKSSNSPFLGESLVGKVKYTVVKGFLTSL